MFRITRGIHIQHGPAYPSPARRFPDGTPMPIYPEVDSQEAPAPEKPQRSEAPAPTTSGDLA